MADMTPTSLVAAVAPRTVAL